MVAGPRGLTGQPVQYLVVRRLHCCQEAAHAVTQNLSGVEITVLGRVLTSSTVITFTVLVGATF